MSGLIEMIPMVLKGSVGALKSPETPTVISPKPPEKASKIEEKKKIKAKLPKSTVLTSPLGLTGAAPTKKPTLLGG